MSKNFVISKSDGDTASMIMAKVIKKYLQDKKNKIERAIYIVREFPKSSSVDIAGNNVVSPEMRFTRFDISSTLNGDKINSTNPNKLDAWCKNLHNQMGIPHIIRCPVKLKLLKTRSLEDVKQALEKAERKKIYELKRLREINEAATEIINPETIAKLNVLGWLYNSGKGREISTCLDGLWTYISRAESDRLFYVRKHMNTPLMHKCHDEEINESIKIFKWYFMDKNPLSKSQGLCCVY